MTLHIPREAAREIAPSGSHHAVCYLVVDLGTQSGQYGAKRQLYIGWELPEEKTTRGKPFTIGKFYSLTANPKGNLRQDLESWFGRVLDQEALADLDLLEELRGRTCTLGVMRDSTQGGQPRAIITSVMLPRRGIPAQTATANAPLGFSLEGALDREVYNALPEWLRQIIAKSPEYQQATAPAMAGGTTDERLKQRLGAVPPETSGAPDARNYEVIDDAIPI